MPSRCPGKVSRSGRGTSRLERHDRLIRWAGLRIEVETSGHVGRNKISRRYVEMTRLSRAGLIMLGLLSLVSLAEPLITDGQHPPMTIALIDAGASA